MITWANKKRENEEIQTTINFQVPGVLLSLKSDKRHIMKDQESANQPLIGSFPRNNRIIRLHEWQRLQASNLENNHGCPYCGALSQHT